MDKINETQAVLKLRSEGLFVEVVDPTATKFNRKYTVYANMPPLGKRLVIVDEDGEIIGRQG